MKIYVERDSVCAGDDVDAPHAIVFEMFDGSTLREVLEAIRHHRYLASIQGGKATWVATGEFPLAVIAQQWETPHFLLDPDTLANETIGAKGLYFDYLAQIDPNDIVRAFTD